ncbi:MAG: Glu-tRNA(Gln) amidotransferase subunit GatD [Methanolinea sp.]|nr:Glu-tRNA(Gln) amidotransferase subunit GatD [Methanolinea sp.]
MTGFSPGDRVAFAIGGRERTATYITERDGMAVVKLDSGYNVGIPPGDCRLVEKGVSPQVPAKEVVQNPSLPRLSIVSTGGTIASRIDYRTGAVTSQFDASDILRAIPGLAEIAQFRTRKISTILSENMTPSLWQDLARAVFSEIKDGVEGVIVTHGTDTMAYSAAALSFMIETPVPIVFVGSQRSADRPSSDNQMNALCSAKTAVSDLGEVVVVMHETTSDDRCAIHRGTRVRKMHTSRRDAFKSIGTPPLGHVSYPDLRVTLGPGVKKRGEAEPSLRDRLEDRCALVQFYPGMPPEALGQLDSLEGLVIAGTGLGHVSSALVPVIGDLVRDGVMVVMTSQCLHGRVCDRVYDTGRDLLKAGVIEGEDMLPETALVKLMWVLGNARDAEEARALMRENLKGEYSPRSVPWSAMNHP